MHSGGMSTTTSPSGRRITPWRARLHGHSHSDSVGYGIRAARCCFLNQLYAGHESPLPDIADVRAADEIPLQPLGELLSPPAHGFHNVVFIKQVETGETHGARQRVARVRVPVKESLELLIRPEERAEDLLGRERRCQGQISGADPFAQAQYVRLDPVVIDGKHVARAPETGGHLITNQEHAMVLREVAQRAHVSGRLRPHARCALHERFDDEGSQPGAMVPQQRRRLIHRSLQRVIGTQPALPAIDMRRVELVTREEQRFEEAMERFRVSNAHGTQGVPMYDSVRAANCVRWLSPWSCQYWNAIFNAISTAVAPASE